MSSDLGADLLRKIRAEFASELGADNTRLAKLLKKIESGKGDLNDVSLFSTECGSALSKAIAKHVTPKMQADPTFTNEVASAVLQGTLRDNYQLINLAARAAQEQADRRLGIHLAPQKAAFPGERIEHIAIAAADKTANEQTQRRRLDAPVRNVTESFYTDYVEENAKFRERAGLKTEIIRQTNGKCCDWCAALAGHYTLSEAPANIWAFHDNCTCTVLYNSAKTTSLHSRYNRRGTKLEGKERRQALKNARKATRFTKEQAKNLQDSVLNRVANSGESGIIRVSGAISGALNPDSKEAQDHADQYYESVRHMTNDVNRIAKNTGFSADLIFQIKDFIFMQKHDLGGKELEYFYPSYEMAQSWQRLIEGKNIQPHDLTLLNHEKMERELMAQGYSQNEAHDITSRVYNYGDESREYYANINKHSKNR